MRAPKDETDEQHQNRSTSFTKFWEISKEKQNVSHEPLFASVRSGIPADMCMYIPLPYLSLHSYKQASKGFSSLQTTNGVMLTSSRIFSAHRASTVGRAVQQLYRAGASSKPALSSLPHRYEQCKTTFFKFRLNFALF